MRAIRFFVNMLKSNTFWTAIGSIAALFAAIVWYLVWMASGDTKKLPDPILPPPASNFRITPTDDLPKPAVKKSTMDRKHKLLKGIYSNSNVGDVAHRIRADQVKEFIDLEWGGKKSTEMRRFIDLSNADLSNLEILIS